MKWRQHPDMIIAVDWDVKHQFKNISLFELVHNVPGHRHGHVGTLPLFYGTFTQYQDVMTSKKSLKQVCHICMVGLI